jgi:hypothetical protein
LGWQELAPTSKIASAMGWPLSALRTSSESWMVMVSASQRVTAALQDFGSSGCRRGR